MKVSRLLSLVACLALLLGSAACTHIPAGSADEIHSRTSVLGVALTSDLLGIKVTGKTATAADAQFGLSFPGFDHHTSAKNLKLPNPPDK